jgi:hypothetical protein
MPAIPAGMTVKIQPFCAPKAWLKILANQEQV